MCRNTAGKTSCTKEEETSNTIYARKIGPYESRSCRISANGKLKHETHIADCGHKFLSLYNLAHLPKLIPKGCCGYVLY